MNNISNNMNNNINNMNNNNIESSTSESTSSSSNEYTTLLSKYNVLHNNYNILTSSYNNIKTDFTFNLNIIDHLNTELNNKNNIYTNIKTLLLSREKEISGLNATIGELKSECALELSRVKYLEDEIVKINKVNNTEIGDSNNEKLVLSNTLELEKKRLLDTNIELNKSNKEIEQLKLLINNNKVSYDNNLSKLYEEMATKSLNLTCSEAENKELTSKLTNYLNEIELLKKLSVEQENKYNLLSNDNSNKQHEMEKICLQFDKKYCELEKQFKMELTRNTELSDKLIKLQVSYVSASNNNNTCQTTLEALIKGYKELELVKLELDKVIGLKNDNIQKQNNIQLNLKLENFTKTESDLKLDREHHIRSYENLTTQNNQLNDNIRNLTDLFKEKSDEINQPTIKNHNLETIISNLKSENEDCTKLIEELRKQNEDLKKPSPITNYAIESLQAQLLTLQSKYNSLVERDNNQSSLKIDSNEARILPFKTLTKSESTKSLKAPLLDICSPKSQYADLNIASPKFLSPFEDFGYASPLPVIRNTSPVETNRLDIIKIEINKLKDSSNRLKVEEIEVRLEEIFNKLSIEALLLSEQSMKNNKSQSNSKEYLGSISPDDSYLKNVLEEQNKHIETLNNTLYEKSNQYESLIAKYTYEASAYKSKASIEYSKLSHDFNSLKQDYNTLYASREKLLELSNKLQAEVRLRRINSTDEVVKNFEDHILKLEDLVKKLKGQNELLQNDLHGKIADISLLQAREIKESRNQFTDTSELNESNSKSELSDISTHLQSELNKIIPDPSLHSINNYVEIYQNPNVLSSVLTNRPKTSYISDRATHSQKVAFEDMARKKDERKPKVRNYNIKSPLNENQMRRHSNRFDFI